MKIVNVLYKISETQFIAVIEGADDGDIKKNNTVRCAIDWARRSIRDTRSRNYAIRVISRRDYMVEDGDMVDDFIERLYLDNCFPKKCAKDIVDAFSRQGIKFPRQ